MISINLKDFKKVLENEKIYYLSIEDRICSNRYLIINELGECLLIDAGDGKDRLSFVPKLCILTHGHFDHTMGVEKNWKTYISEKENKDLEYIRIPSNAKKIKQSLFKFGKYHLEIIPTPGHTPGSISIFERNKKILFSGDTLFANRYIGRTDLGGSEKEIKNSLRILDKLDWKILCPGHGELEYRV